MEHIAYIGLGGNVEPRAETLIRALALLDERPGVSVRRVSRLIQTAPVGPQDQPDFLNAAAEIATTLGPTELMKVLHEVEGELGRDRAHERRWGPRTCDLDLLLYDDRVVDDGGLKVPHPRLHERTFVLRPLAEIAPDVVHPVRGKSIARLLEEAEGAR